jgi:cell division protein FtsL
MRAPFARAARARVRGMIDTLLRGRAWIALVAVLLVGIVFFNVDLLELNRDIARTDDKASTLKRQNGNLRLQVARLASSERIQRVAARHGLELPAPGEVRYLKLHPDADARNAAGHITEPGEGTATPVSSGAPASAPAVPAQTAPAAPAPTPTGTAPQSPPQTTTTTPSPPTPAAPAPTAPPAAGSPSGGAAPAPGPGSGG